MTTAGVKLMRRMMTWLTNERQVDEDVSLKLVVQENLREVATC